MHGPSTESTTLASHKAREMIDSQQYELDAEWSDAAPSTEDSNDKIERDGYDGYGEWHLAVDTEASEGTKDRYGFPFGDFRRVVRSGSGRREAAGRAERPRRRSRRRPTS